MGMHTFATCHHDLSIHVVRTLSETSSRELEVMHKVLGGSVGLLLSFAFRITP